jgi:serine/threonine-protein phosphatase 2B regulatory subunit
LLNKEDVDKLYHHFLRFDADGNGMISREEFLRHPAVSSNPLSRRILDLFDADGNGDIDFGEFVSGLARFSARGNVEARLKFIFDLYDVDGDGYVSNGELFWMLRRMIGNGGEGKGHLTDEQLQQVVDRTIRDLDKDRDGRLCWEEFRGGVEVKNLQLLNRLCIKNL